MNTSFWSNWVIFQKVHSKHLRFSIEYWRWTVIPLKKNWNTEVIAMRLLFQNRSYQEQGTTPKDSGGWVELEKGESSSPLWPHEGVNFKIDFIFFYECFVEGHQILWNWSYRSLLVVTWVLGTNPKSSARATSDHNCPVITQPSLQQRWKGRGDKEV